MPLIFRDEGGCEVGRVIYSVFTPEQAQSLTEHGLNPPRRRNALCRPLSNCDSVWRGVSANIAAFGISKEPLTEHGLNPLRRPPYSPLLLFPLPNVNRMSFKPA